MGKYVNVSMLKYVYVQLCKCVNVLVCLFETASFNKHVKVWICICVTCNYICFLMCLVLNRCRGLVFCRGCLFCRGWCFVISYLITNSHMLSPTQLSFIHTLAHPPVLLFIHLILNQSINQLID